MVVIQNIRTDKQNNNHKENDNKLKKCTDNSDATEDDHNNYVKH